MPRGFPEGTPSPPSGVADANRGSSTLRKKPRARTAYREPGEMFDLIRRLCLTNLSEMHGEIIQLR